MKRPPLDVDIFASNFDEQYTRLPIDIDMKAEIEIQSIILPFG